MIFNRKFAQDMNKQFNWDSPTDLEFFGQAAAPQIAEDFIPDDKEDKKKINYKMLFLQGIHLET